MIDIVEEKIKRLELALYYAEEDLKFNRKFKESSERDRIQIGIISDQIQKIKIEYPEYFI